MPLGKLDISGGKVIIHGDNAGLDMSCNDISNVNTIHFCDGGGLNFSCNDISGVKTIYFCDISGASGGLDMSCNDISNVETIYFCDPSNSSISSGSSLDISSTAIHFNISNHLHALDISSNGYVGIGTGNPQYPLDVSGHVMVGGGNIYFGEGTGVTV